jgi:ribosomal protein S27E
VVDFQFVLKIPFTGCFGGCPSLDYAPTRTAHKARGRGNFMAEGYCVKCKAKKEIANGVEETMKNGRKAIKGKCPTCGTVMFKILGGKAAASATPANPPATN